jgi:hypothetical protein
VASDLGKASATSLAGLTAGAEVEGAVAAAGGVTNVEERALVLASVEAGAGVEGAGCQAEQGGKGDPPHATRQELDLQDQLVDTAAFDRRRLGWTLRDRRVEAGRGVGLGVEDDRSDTGLSVEGLEETGGLEARQ